MRRVPFTRSTLCAALAAALLAGVVTSHATQPGQGLESTLTEHSGEASPVHGTDMHHPMDRLAPFDDPMDGRMLTLGDGSMVRAGQADDLSGSPRSLHDYPMKDEPLTFGQGSPLQLPEDRGSAGSQSPRASDALPDPMVVEPLQVQAQTALTLHGRSDTSGRSSTKWSAWCERVQERAVRHVLPGNPHSSRSMHSPPFEASDGNVYVLSSGVQGDAQIGSLLRIRPDGRVQYLALPGWSGAALEALGLNEGPDGSLYAVLRTGLLIGSGQILRIDPDTASWSSVYIFGFADDGRRPSSPLLRARDGRLYGVTLHGGAQDQGTLYRIGKDGRYESLLSFAAPRGLRSTDSDSVGKDSGTPAMHSPAGALVEDSEGRVLGTAKGPRGEAVVFRYDPDTGRLSRVGATPEGWTLHGLMRARDGVFHGLATACGPASALLSVGPDRPGQQPGSPPLTRWVFEPRLANPDDPTAHRGLPVEWPGGDVHLIRSSGAIERLRSSVARLAPDQQAWARQRHPELDESEVHPETSWLFTSHGMLVVVDGGGTRDHPGGMLVLKDPLACDPGDDGERVSDT